MMGDFALLEKSFFLFFAVLEFSARKIKIKALHFR